MKAMNCPGHFLLYASEAHSYRDLPIRFHEQTPLHRNEAVGRAVRPHPRPAVLAGRRPLLRDAGADRRRSRADAAAGAARVRRLRPDATGEALDAARRSSSATIATWDHAEAQLRAALERAGIDVHGQREGRRVLRPEDRLRRHRRDRPQVAVRDDPARLHDAGALRPEVHRRRQHRAPRVVIHRAIFGSFERFIAHPDRALRGRVSALAGARAGGRPADFGSASGVRGVGAGRLAAAGLRVELDERQEKIGYKIREAQLQKIPYMLVVGDRESGGGHGVGAQPRRRRPGSTPGRRVHRVGARRESPRQAAQAVAS